MTDSIVLDHNSNNNIISDSTYDTDQEMPELCELDICELDDKISDTNNLIQKLVDKMAELCDYEDNSDDEMPELEGQMIYIDDRIANKMPTLKHIDFTLLNIEYYMESLCNTEINRVELAEKIN